MVTCRIMFWYRNRTNREEIEQFFVCLSSLFAITILLWLWINVIFIILIPIIIMLYYVTSKNRPFVQLSLSIQLIICFGWGLTSGDFSMLILFWVCIYLKLCVHSGTYWATIILFYWECVKRKCDQFHIHIYIINLTS